MSTGGRWLWLWGLVALGHVLACGGEKPEPYSVRRDGPSAGSDAQSERDAGGAGSSNRAGSDAQLERDAGGGVSEIRGCDLLTMDDAAALFETTANLDPRAPPFSEDSLGWCVWLSTVPDMQSPQYLSILVWEGPDLRMPVGDNSEPFDVGQQGYIEKQSDDFIIAGWLHGELVIRLEYGDGIPPTDGVRIEPFEEIAQRVDDRL